VILFWAAHNAYAALSYTGELCKMAEPVEMPFGRQAPVQALGHNAT